MIHWSRVSLVLPLGFCVLAGWALAQSGGSDGQASSDQRVGGGEVGRYSISSGGAGAMLLDTSTGKTWGLVRSADQTQAAWVPMVRVDTEEAAEAWRSEQREKVKAAVERENEERRAERKGGKK